MVRSSLLVKERARLLTQTWRPEPVRTDVWTDDECAFGCEVPRKAGKPCTELPIRKQPLLNSRLDRDDRADKSSTAELSHATGNTIDQSQVARMLDKNGSHQSAVQVEKNPTPQSRLLDLPNTGDKLRGSPAVRDGSRAPSASSPCSTPRSRLRRQTVPYRTSMITLIVMQTREAFPLTNVGSYLHFAIAVRHARSISGHGAAESTGLRRWTSRT